jgi:homoserine dehydrogenase
MREVKIAILGLGNVGQGVWRILNTNKEEIMRRSGCHIDVHRILVRDMDKKRDVDIPEGILTSNPDDIFEDEDEEIPHIIVKLRNISEYENTSMDSSSPQFLVTFDNGEDQEESYLQIES